MDKKQALLDLARSSSAHSYADLAKAAGCKPQTVWRSAKQWGISAQLVEIFKRAPATEAVPVAPEATTIVPVVVVAPVISSARIRSLGRGENGVLNDIDEVISSMTAFMRGVSSKYHRSTLQKEFRQSCLELYTITRNICTDDTGGYIPIVVDPTPEPTADELKNKINAVDLTKPVVYRQRRNQQ